jgi:choline dehydrogenase-like flavoprotein
MTPQTLGETGTRETRLSTSVCVVGAGIAGLIAATRLARDKNRRIVLVESGRKDVTPAISALNEIDNLGDPYEGALTARFRGLGGTSLLWAGKLLPLSKHDTVPRPYLNLDGWPFSLAELEPYREELEQMMGVDPESHEEDISDRLDPHSLLPRNDEDFLVRWPKRPTPKNHNLAYVLRQEIETLDNLEIWLGSSVSHFKFDPVSGKVIELTARNHEGQSLTVAADEFLITAGTLESTRLLLLADQQSNFSISRQSDALGRYFNDHLGLDVATLRPIDQTRTNLGLSDRSTFSSLRHLHFELRPGVQEAQGIGSAYFDIGCEQSEHSALTKCAKAIQGLKQRRWNLNFQDARALVLDFPSLLRTAQWQYLRKQKYWPPDAKLQIKIWVEQLPSWHNRISLSEKLDGLQIPQLKLEWKKTESDEKTFQVMIKKIAGFWERSFAQTCRLEWRADLSRPDFRAIDPAFDLAHPAGSTRMGSNPSDSVVDPFLRVHQIPNLSVASASVFPTSGSANPTFTIMQLAMRTADAIAARLNH